LDCGDGVAGRSDYDVMRVTLAMMMMTRLDVEVMRRLAMVTVEGWRTIIVARSLTR
jgi:hypothetical protein